MSTTLDRDLFLPADAGNLLAAWHVCRDHGFELFAGTEPIDEPRDAELARAVVERRALTRASDGMGTDVDLSLVMGGFDFEAIWPSRRVFVRGRRDRDSGGAALPHRGIGGEGGEGEGSALSLDPSGGARSHIARRRSGHLTTGSSACCISSGGRRVTARRPSSPRIRTARCRTASSPRSSEGRQRFIPARAGNTPPKTGRQFAQSVHPRAGGEHRSRSRVAAASDGSSPRGRGTRAGSGRHGRPSRFIPARAGNTSQCRSTRLSPTVHPRAGGEHDQVFRWPKSRSGSSPRGRGTPAIDVFRRGEGRFIPARARNTAKPARSSGAATVHPRAGGEHAIGALRGEHRGGSSPRGRGTRPSTSGRAGCSRFIPARAGNTVASASRSRSLKVHPRAGGEHLSTAA